MIPKKIHYCWFGKTQFPKTVKKCFSTWSNHLSDYEFKLWDETNSPMDHPFVKQAYNAKKYAFVSDYVRLWALYNEGGIYLDTDMYVIRNFDELLLDDIFFGYETLQMNYISAGIIGANKDDAFIHKILTYYNFINFEYSNINNIKIPTIITKAYVSYENKSSIRIYPFDFFYAFPYEKRNKTSNFSNYITDQTYAIHLWDLSWYTWKDFIKEKYGNLRKKIKTIPSE